MYRYILFSGNQNETKSIAAIFTELPNVPKQHIILSIAVGSTKKMCKRCRWCNQNRDLCQIAIRRECRQKSRQACKDEGIHI